jgi:nucleoid DNA-binding protein
MNGFTSNALLISRTAAKAGVPQSAARKILQSFVQVLYEELATGATVSVKGMGKISMVAVAPRQGRNPATGASVAVAGTVRPHIRWSSMVKSSVLLHNTYVKGVRK